MAVPTGAGTETLHAHHFEAIANTFRQVIIGVQQKLMFTMTSADGGGQDFDVHCTYLDQDWS